MVLDWLKWLIAIGRSFVEGDISLNTSCSSGGGARIFGD